MGYKNKMKNEILTPNKLDKLLSNDELMKMCREDYDKLQTVIGDLLSIRDKLIALKMDYVNLYKEYMKLKKAQKSTKPSKRKGA